VKVANVGLAWTLSSHFSNGAIKGLKMDSKGLPRPGRVGAVCATMHTRCADRKPETGDLLFVSTLSGVVQRLIKYNFYDDNDCWKVAVSEMVGTEGLYGRMSIVTCK
jgi:hypothetical protein